MPSLKRKLHSSDARLSTVVCTIPSAVVTQALAASGVDSIVVDLEHGAIDYGSAHAMIAATAGTDCSPLVRVAEIDATQVKRALDLGAEGVMFPLVRTAQDAQKAVDSLRYPPDGTRGFGPFIAQSRWGKDFASYASEIQPDLFCCLLVETADAVENIEQICAVPGIDLLIPAQFDLSTDLGLMGQFDHPVFKAAVARIEDAARAAGIALGNVALTQDRASELFDQGYRLIGGFDTLWMREKAAEIHGWCQT